jgi:recombination protein RecA
VEQGIIKKSGAFYSYGETKLGQGRENSKDFLIQHPEIAASVEGRLRSPGSDAGPEGEAVANDGPAQTKDTVADILSGAALQEPEEPEEEE